MSRVLLLSPYPEILEPIFKKNFDAVYTFNGNINKTIPSGEYDKIVSFGYRHIINSNFLKNFEGQIYNIHISALPWNRGADPNFWSIVDATPSGVTIHEIDEGLDTGKIVYQKLILFEDLDIETLATTYEKLRRLAAEAFSEFWLLQKRTSIDQKYLSTIESQCHKSNEKNTIMADLSNGWETPLVDIISKCYNKKSIQAARADIQTDCEGVVLAWNIERSVRTLRLAVAAADLACIAQLEKYLRKLYAENEKLPNRRNVFEKLAPDFIKKKLTSQSIIIGDFKLRAATALDSEMLFRWRNDEITRKNSQKFDFISKEEHERWCANSLFDDSRRIYIAEYKNLPVGTIRLDSNDSQDVSKLYWTVDPDSRRKGFGSVMLQMICDYYKSRKLIAPIKETDIASLRMVAKSGFMKTTHINDVETWIRSGAK